VTIEISTDGIVPVLPALSTQMAQKHAQALLAATRGKSERKKAASPGGEAAF
jgi:hypothetical protein